VIGVGDRQVDLQLGLQQRALEGRRLQLSDQLGNAVVGRIGDGALELLREPGDFERRSGAASP
jgi:hypothetical protein